MMAPTVVWVPETDGKDGIIVPAVRALVQRVREAYRRRQLAAAVGSCA